MARIDLFAHGLDNHEVAPGITASVDLPCYKITFTNASTRWVAAPGAVGRRSKGTLNIPIIIDQKQKRVTQIHGGQTLDITGVHSVDLRPIKQIPEELRDRKATAAMLERIKKQTFYKPSTVPKEEDGRGGKRRTDPQKSTPKLPQRPVGKRRNTNPHRG